jgi:hypothetical protein
MKIEMFVKKKKKCKKLIKSTKFVDTKLGTLTRTQPNRDLKKKDLKSTRLSHYPRKYDEDLKMAKKHL